LLAKGYSISLEFIGENTRSLEECIKAKNELLKLIDDLGRHKIKGTISFDLSHIGLMVDEGLSYDHLVELAEKAQTNELNLMISMEESAKTDQIISIYEKAAKDFAT
jgi:proline dehydrogenase